MTVRDKLHSFIENYKIGRLDICYDISKFFVKNKIYIPAMWTLLIFMKRFKREDTKFLPHLHKLIAELLTYKYPFLSFFQNITPEVINSEFPQESYVSFHSPYFGYENYVENILNNFSHHENWQYMQSYKDELNYYTHGIITKEDSWRERRFARHSTQDSKPIINKEKIIKNKIKGYSWCTVINFGGNKDKSVQELFEFNPKIISAYLENLRHFVLNLDFWFSYKVFTAYGPKQYWLLFEKNLIKLILSIFQRESINYINQLEWEYKREYAEEMNTYMSYFDGDDDESIIFRALMNGNGDAIGY